jgi:hypothetical protein
MAGVVMPVPDVPGVEPGPIAVFAAICVLGSGVGRAVADGCLKFGRGMSSPRGSQYLVQPYQPSADTATNASTLPKPEPLRRRRAGE